MINSFHRKKAVDPLKVSELPSEPYVHLSAHTALPLSAYKKQYSQYVREAKGKRMAFDRAISDSKALVLIGMIIHWVYWTW